MLGFSESIWLMSSSSAMVRRNRARLLQREETRNHLAFAREWVFSADGFVQSIQAQLESEGKDLLDRGVKQKYEATEVIRVASRYVQERMPELGDGLFGTQAVSFWRRLSAQAHGRTWDKPYRPDYVKVAESETHGLLGTSPQTVSWWVSIAMPLGLAAWNLFDDGRRKAPHDGESDVGQ